MILKICVLILATILPIHGSGLSGGNSILSTKLCAILGGTSCGAPPVQPTTTYTTSPITPPTNTYTSPTTSPITYYTPTYIPTPFPVPVTTTSNSANPSPPKPMNDDDGARRRRRGRAKRRKRVQRVYPNRKRRMSRRTRKG